MPEPKIVVDPTPMVCPKCGAKEVEDTTLPAKEWVFNIRAYRVEMNGRWYSQCLVCAANGDEAKGWF